jgi:hypothetical protein
MTLKLLHSEFPYILGNLDFCYRCTSYGVGLKSGQAWGCLSSMKCIFKDIRSALTPSLYLNKKNFWEISRQIKMCAQPTGEIFPTPPPFSFLAGVDSWQRSWLYETTPAYGPTHHVFLWIQPLYACVESQEGNLLGCLVPSLFWDVEQATATG